MAAVRWSARLTAGMAQGLKRCRGAGAVQLRRSGSAPTPVSGARGARAGGTGPVFDKQVGGYDEGAWIGARMNSISIGASEEALEAKTGRES